MEPSELTRRWLVTQDCARCSYIPPGWESLVDRLMCSLADIRGWDPGYTYQIKSKFGQLRFYYGVPEVLGEAFRQAVQTTLTRFTEEASRTCERCGGVQAVNTRADDVGWARTECAVCRPPSAPSPTG